MIAIYTLCAWIAWTPAENAEAHYFYEDGLPGIVAWDNEMDVCRVDYDVPHTYSVAGFVEDAEGELHIGPESDSLTVVWPVPEPSQNAMLFAGTVTVGALARRRLRRS